MKVTVSVPEFRRAFGLAAMVVPNKSPKPILASILFTASADGAALQATNLEISVAVPVPLVTVDQPGACLLRADRVAAVLGATADDTLVIDVEDGESQVRIAGLRSEFHLSMDDPALYPAVPAGVDGERVEVRAGDLLRAVRRTVYAVDDGANNRYAISGVAFDNDGKSLLLVATDGRRLSRQIVRPADALPASWFDRTNDTSNVAVVPVNALKLVARIANDADDDSPVLIGIDRTSARFVIEGATVYTRLVEGRFPRWRDTLEGDRPLSVTTPVGVLLSAVNQAQITTSPESEAADWHIDGRLRLTSRASDVGSSSVECDATIEGAEGETIVAIKPKFVADVLKAMDPEDEVRMAFGVGKAADRTSACLTVGDDFLAIVAPLSRDRT